MFFGSGNLVFPLLIGQQSQSAFGSAGLGLTLTGIFVPLLGMLSLLAYGGDVRTYMNHLGKRTGWLLTFFILALLGPFGVCPRCILVAYGGVHELFPQLPLWLFASIFCSLVAVMAWKPKIIIDWIGKGLTPLLLTGIGCLFIYGLGSQAPESDLSSMQAFKIGFFRGYETMDLLAAFFFSGTIATYMHTQAQGETRHLIALSVGASLLGAGLLGAVYWGLVALGAQHATLLESVHSSAYLVTVAQATLGPWALPVVSATITLACLTTMLILSQLFAQFIADTSRRLSRSAGGHGALLLTLSLCFLQVHLQFDRLEHFLENILEVAYPALIVFALTMFLDRLRQTRWSPITFWLACVGSMAYGALC